MSNDTWNEGEEGVGSGTSAETVVDDDGLLHYIPGNRYAVPDKEKAPLPGGSAFEALSTP